MASGSVAAVSIVTVLITVTTYRKGMKLLKLHILQGTIKVDYHYTRNSIMESMEVVPPTSMSLTPPTARESFCLLGTDAYHMSTL